MSEVHRLYPQVTWAALSAEIARELKQRIEFYPQRVETLKMSQDAANHQLAVCKAWLEDCARIPDRQILSGVHADNPPAHGVSWSDRVAGLERELTLRERFYPERVSTLQMTKETADHRIACLAALLAVYEEGWDWIASNQAPTSHGAIKTTAAIEQARREWKEHWLRVEARRNPAKQGEMAL